MSLNPRQYRFCDEFLVDLNATQAAIRAGYKVNSAEVTGCRLLSNAKVMSRVSSLQNKRAEATGVDAGFVLSRLYAEAQADLADIHDNAGRLLPIAQWPEIWRKGLVTSIEISDRLENGKVVGQVCRIRLRDRTRVLELLGRHVQVQAFQTNVRTTSLDGLCDRLERASKRL